jgi:hypothetical protein
MRHIKHSFYIVTFILLSNCSGDRGPIQRLTGYEYPLDSLRDRKIFVYKKNVPNEYYFVEQKLIRENDTEYILNESYDLKQKISAGKFRITKDGIEEIETYLYRYPDSLKNEYQKDKGEILESKNITDGQKYRGSFIKMKILTSGNIRGNMTAQQTFIREDKLPFNGQDLDVLVFTNDITVKAWHRFIPFFSSETIYTGENYYARGIGLVKYSTNTDTEKFEWTLVDIKKVTD